MKKKQVKRAHGRIKILRDGPYEVLGGLTLKKQTVISGKDGVPLKWADGSMLHPEGKTYRLCRCGRSANKPYCDGTHHAVKFNGTETAGRKKHAEVAKTTSGPALQLRDAEKLCAISLFCHRAGDAWTLTESSGNKRTHRLLLP